MRIAVIAWMILVILEVSLVGGVGLAQSPSPNLTMQYDQQSLNIEVDNADLKQVLARLAAIADITVEYPVALERMITLNRRGISIEDALEAMLIGINHIIFYAGPSSNQAEITKVSILGKAMPRRPATPRQRQLAKRIASYQKQLTALQRRVATIDTNSSQSRRYRQRIRRLEQSIARLEAQR